MTKPRRRPSRKRPHVIPITPRRLLGHVGPVVVGVMSDARPALIQEWT